MKNHLPKRDQIFLLTPYLVFLLQKPFKKDDMQQKQFLENLGLLIVKNHLPLQFVKSSYLKRFSMHLCLEEFFFAYKNKILMNYCSN